MSATRTRSHKPLLCVIVGLLSALLSACLDDAVVECADGRMCPAGYACDQAHQGCVLPAQREACVDKAQGEDCSYRGVSSGACYEHVCLPSGCGNGILDAQEVCDDGNRFHGDHCSADCRSDESCGNGIIDVTRGESCDPAPGDEDAEWCRPGCVSVRCGDGVVDANEFEVCDRGDANSDEPDAKCRPNCQPQRCGDGVRDSGEVCDDGNARSGDGCSADCGSNETCGNGVIDGAVGETCEPSDSNVGWCRPNCVNVRCGDDTLDEQFEECDEGEQNSIAADAACRPNCQARRCGDRIKDSDEACDDGDHDDGDGCSHDCESLETCGNGYTDLSKGETCDDGNFLSHDGCSSRCRRETPLWQNVTVPVVPIGSATAYDATRDTALLLSYSSLLELRGASWQALSPPHLPRVADGVGMAWDSARRRIVLFGGADADGYLSNDIWEWDGHDWLRRVPSSLEEPVERSGPVLTYDATRGRTVVFGGYDNDGTWLGDTWEWDGQAWHLVSDTGWPTKPAIGGSFAYTSAFDPVTASVVAFDGFLLWTFAEGAWTWLQATVSSDEHYGQRSLVFDAGRGHLVYRSPGFDGAPADTLWELIGSAWQPILAPSGTGDIDGQLFYRTARRRLAFVTESAVWELDGSTWTQRDSSQVPPPRSEAALIYDPLRGQTVLFGGHRLLPDADDDFALADTWLWDGAVWSHRTPRTEPPARVAHALVYDPVARQVVMFGGGTCCDSPSELKDDTWTWDGEDWTEAHPASSPPPRQDHAMAFDAARGEVVMFGGGSWSRGVYRNDLWTWNGQTWTDHEVDAGPAPCAAHGLSYDPIRRAVLMAGGVEDGPSSGESPTWTWDGSRWQTVDVPGLTTRWQFAMPYDANRKSTLIISGQFSDNVHTWSLPAVAASAPAREWEPLPVAFSRDPQVSGHAAVYEPLHGRTLVLANGESPTWHLSYRAAGESDEVCQYGFDIDGDGLIGCADPDCWGYCTPLCPPGAECEAELSRCGDGTCNTALETCRMCPEDCACEPACGDFFCDAGETEATCPGDCTLPAP